MYICKNKYLYYIIILISFIYLLIITYYSLNYFSIWSDEIFTLRLIQLPISSMMSEIVNDVHPPLYYFIYRFAFEISEIFKYNNVILIGRIISLIPLYLLFITGLTKVKKDFNICIASIFTLFIVSMPQFMYYFLEIRMYGWSILFLTLSFIYAYEILQNPTEYKKWIALTLLTIASAYTHYFAAISSFCLYLFLFTFYLKEKKLPKEFLISTFTAIIAYIPWIFPLISQLTNVSNNYWIKPMNINTYMDTILFVVSPEKVRTANSTLLQYKIFPILFSIIILIIIAYLIINYYKSDHDFEGNFSIYGLIIFISVPIIGLIVSNIFRPIFIERYMLPCFGILWLSISILLSKVNKKIIFIAILATFLILGCYTTIKSIENEEYVLISLNNEYNTLNNIIEPNSTIIIDDYMGYVNFDTFLLPNNHYIILTNETYHNNSVIIQGNIIINKNITEILKDYKNAYYVDVHKDNPINEELVLNFTQKPTFKPYTIYKIN